MFTFSIKKKPSALNDEFWLMSKTQKGLSFWREYMKLVNVTKRKLYTLYAISEPKIELLRVEIRVLFKLHILFEKYIYIICKWNI